MRHFFTALALTSVGCQAPARAVAPELLTPTSRLVEAQTSDLRWLGLAAFVLAGATVLLWAFRVNGRLMSVALTASAFGVFTWFAAGVIASYGVAVYSAAGLAAIIAVLSLCLFVAVRYALPHIRTFIEVSRHVTNARGSD